LGIKEFNACCSIALVRGMRRSSTFFAITTTLPGQIEQIVQ
jgi:hypothetical protein